MPWGLPDEYVLSDEGAPSQAPAQQPATFEYFVAASAALAGSNFRVGLELFEDDREAALQKPDLSCRCGWSALATRPAIANDGVGKSASREGRFNSYLDDASFDAPHASSTQRAGAILYQTPFSKPLRTTGIFGFLTAILRPNPHSVGMRRFRFRWSWPTPKKLWIRIVQLLLRRDKLSVRVRAGGLPPKRGNGGQAGVKMQACVCRSPLLTGPSVAPSAPSDDLGPQEGWAS